MGLLRPAARLGLRVDLRKAQPYDVYDRMEFDVPVGTRAIATTVISYACSR